MLRRSLARCFVWFAYIAGIAAMLLVKVLRLAFGDRALVDALIICLYDPKAEKALSEIGVASALSACRAMLARIRAKFDDKADAETGALQETLDPTVSAPNQQWAQIRDAMLRDTERDVNNYPKEILVQVLFETRFACYVMRREIDGTMNEEEAACSSKS